LHSQPVLNINQQFNKSNNNNIIEEELNNRQRYSNYELHSRSNDRVVCPHCGLEGHLRITSSKCLQNKNNQEPIVLDDSFEDVKIINCFNSIILKIS
jgi:formamidopyrimidine-DNA glycosylase